MKKIFIFLPLLIICIVSCGAPVEVDENSKELRESFWIDTSNIVINDYYTGAEANKTSVIVRVHCSELPRHEYTKWLVETFDQETEVEFTLKAPLADYDTDKVSVISSDINETLQLITYQPATNTIIVGGFLPNSKRYMEVRYPAWTRYLVQPVEPYENNLTKGCDMPPDGYTQWVKIDKPLFILKPGGIQEVTVMLDTPPNAVINSDKWEYWLEVGESSISASSGVGVSASMRIRCVINMRG